MPKPARGSIRHWAILSFLLLLLTGTAGCTHLTDFENAQVIDRVPLAYASPDNRLGQTFLLRRAPLTGIKLHLRLNDEAQDMESHLLLRLYSDPQNQETIYVGQVSYQQIKNNFPINVSIPALEIEAGRSLYLELEATGSPVWVYGLAEDQYPHGQFYLAGQPNVGDLAFSLSYQYGLAAFGQDIVWLLSRSWLSLPLLGLLLIPGFLILHFSRFGPMYRLPERLGLALGISLALPAVVFTWTSRVGLQLPFWLVVVLYVILGMTSVLTTLRILRRPGNGSANSNETGYQAKELISGSAAIALVALFLIVLFVRFAMVRDLSGPAWVDPVHHTLITTLIQQTGRIPADFTPYAQASATNYHTGFHVLSAIFSWVSGLEPIDSLFILGQVLNAAALFAVYLLAYELTGSRLVGIFAALLTGFASPMPAYYTSWGRYTQLAGLLILPAGFSLLRQIYRQPSGYSAKAADIKCNLNWPMVLLAAGTCSGLFFIHYRVAAFLACLVAADLLVMAIDRLRKTESAWQVNIFGLSITALASLLLSLPVLIPVIVDLLPRRAVQWNASGSVERFSIPWGFLTAGLGLPLLYVSAAGFLAALVLRLRLAITVLFWTVLMFLAANLNRLGLPTGGFISNDSVVISLFLPLTILGGFIIAAGWRATRSFKLPVRLAAGLLVFILSFYTIFVGSQKLLTIINPLTVFLRAGDRTAAAWISDNLPPDSTFLINPAAWGYGIYVGSDGGYWLSPITGRVTFPPTLLYGHGQREDIAAINQQAAELLENAQDPQFLADFMANRGLDYLFVGVRGGPISALALLQSPQFELLYHQEGAWIFRPSSPTSY